MKDLKASLIRLGHTNPELRPHLRVLIANAEFNGLFGELRSTLSTGKRDKKAYKDVLRILVEMDKENASRTMSEVVPYVERAFEKFPDELKTYGEVTLTTLGKPESKYKLHFAKFFTGKRMPPRALTTKALGLKILLQTKALQRLVQLDLSTVPLTNDQVIEAANNFASTTSLIMNNRNMPRDTVKRLTNLPSYSLHLEGNPGINSSDVENLKAKRPDLEVYYDNPNESTLHIEEIYEVFSEELRGFFDAPDRLEKAPDGAPLVRGSFGRDAHEGRSGVYRIEMTPIQEGDMDMYFRVTVKGEGYDHDSVESFPLPREDRQSREYIGNRFVSKITRSLNGLLYNVMSGRS